MKYVYIYDVNPDYVYMGYTPGYLNTLFMDPPLYTEQVSIIIHGEVHVTSHALTHGVLE